MKQRNKLIMCIGLPASGKSTWAKAMVDANPGKYKRVNKDDLRALIDNSHWSKENEEIIIEIRNEIITQSLRYRKNVIVDDTNLDPKHERDLRDLAEHCDADFGIKDFRNVPLDVCISRDKNRDGTVGRKVILGMYNRYLMTISKPKDTIEGLPFCIICDLDGTACIHNGRSPYDTEKCDTDLPNTPVIELLWAMKKDFEIIFVSGREDKFREKSEKWLNDRGFVGHKLFMRKTDDMRSDEIIKKEIYDAEFEGKYNVLFALDDRDRIVDMWRSNGINCFQVNYGTF
jgi:predicted kinase